MDEKKYTKTEVVNLVRIELIRTFGGLSHDRDGKKLDIPFTVLGVVRASFPDDNISPERIYPDKIVRERDTYFEPVD